MNARPYTVPTMGKPYVRQHMPGHRQMVTLSRRAASMRDSNTPAIEVGRGNGDAGNV
ncbi:hypothetical protein SAMN05660666_02532 [Novosphingobium aromaticivorans]|uniref:hypothetical protein n=1 Tax=Novosphingobium aromaticivorans TaxID=48935 RepID=UPI000876568D|nr:hypothetical protein [Novosphingobium aromaticivorans]SCY69763.1 hypothetical protein SAMN05660666_02532 [Novosphingobium aromaticivorans]